MQTPAGAESARPGGRRGGPRSGASLFLRPARAYGGGLHRQSLDGELRNLSRAYSVAEDPDLVRPGLCAAAHAAHCMDYAGAVHRLYVFAFVVMQGASHPI